MQRWQIAGAQREWPHLLEREDSDQSATLRASTYAGRPFGEQTFIAEIGARFGRQWYQGRPRKDGQRDATNCRHQGLGSVLLVLKTPQIRLSPFPPMAVCHRSRLDALVVRISGRKVNFILDADIRSFFDSVDQRLLIRFMEHRIGDKRVLRLIQKWLKVGVLEDGIVVHSEMGTGQGAVISPLLANIYLHYVFDLWAEQWRQREAQGDMIMVRYADDVVLGFELETDARLFLEAMKARLERFSLTLHPEKTRLIAFGRFAADRRERQGLGKPETFDFLGFTFISGKTRQGNFLVKRTSRRDRVKAKLREIKDVLRRKMHLPVPEQGSWLGQVVTGYFAYHAVPTNLRSLVAFHNHVTNLWQRTLGRRSQNGRLTRADMKRLVCTMASSTAYPTSMA